MDDTIHFKAEVDSLTEDGKEHKCQFAQHWSTELLHFWANDGPFATSWQQSTLCRVYDR